jgi:hypothetical protein
MPLVDFNIAPVNFSPLANIGLAYADSIKQKEQQAQQQQTVAKAQEIMKSGDFNQMADFALANPELGKTMFELGGIRDEAAQKRMTELSKGLTMSQSPVEDLTAYIQSGEQQGRDMSHSKGLLDKSQGNPEALKKMAETSWASADPKTYKSYRTTLPEKTGMTDYQSAMVSSKQVDQDLRREESIIKREEMKLDRETDELKRDEIKNKIDASKQKVEDATRAKQEAANTAINASTSLLNSIDKLAGNSGYIDSLTGYRGRLPGSATDEGVEADALLDNITNSLTLDNLKLMTGVLTDKDIELLKSAASGLKKGMGTDRFNEILQTIRDKVKTSLDAKKGSMPQTQSSEMSDAELLNKYGG